MGLDRLGKRLQARRGAHWTRNTPENTLGLSIPVCPHCRTLNPVPAGELPRHCQACGKPMLPACPSHGEGACTASCAARPCTTCGGTGPVPAHVDPEKFTRGLLCRTCGRETTTELHP